MLDRQMLKIAEEFGSPVYVYDAEKITTVQQAIDYINKNLP